jgi:transcription factor TFIIIB component B''
VDGEIVLDTSSLRIDRHAMAAVERDAEQLDSVEEDEYTRKVNSGLGLKRDKSGGWNEMLVDRFYDGLRMFGTDFGMISKLFPGKSRHSIKLKFGKEEKGDYPRIRAALLGEVVPVELEEFQKMTGEEYDDPAVLEKDIEEDKRRLEEEQEKEKEAIEAARKERAEQAETERLASQGEESSGRESRGRRRKKGEQKGEQSRKRREKGEKRQKGPTRTKGKKSRVVEETVQLPGQEDSNEAP